MPDRRGPNVYSIAAHRGFADALVAGLGQRYEEADVGLARLTLVLPSNRARQVFTEAFIRSGDDNKLGRLLPRMVSIGDLDLDENLGNLFDGFGASDIPPAVDRQRRTFTLAAILLDELGEEAPPGAALFRMARDLGRVMDRLLVEEIDPNALVAQEVLNLLGNLAKHWQESLRTFIRVQDIWLDRLREWNMVDAAQRRNLLFDRIVEQWQTKPPETPIIAAGVTSVAPAVARLLKMISQLPRGAVVLPDFDLTMPSDIWDELGRAGQSIKPGDTPFGKGDAVSHPQYHLKLLLNRMGVAREEVRAWHRKGLSAAPPERSHAIASLFQPPVASRKWVNLPSRSRDLQNVRIMQAANSEEEAQAIALLVREALESPERRISIVTPDRALAARISHHLARWDIRVDDTAGTPLSRTASARMFLLLAELAGGNLDPVTLMSLLEHPLVGSGEGRAQWLANVRRLDLALRGPRPETSLSAIEGKLKSVLPKEGSNSLSEWWSGVAGQLHEIVATPYDDPQSLSNLLDRLATGAEQLCGEALWAKEDGRALSSFIEQFRLHARSAGTRVEPRNLGLILRDAMEEIAVRPPYGGHPRVALYGLLESRMTRSDLVICAGLNEGTWPAASGADTLLAPAILRTIGVPGQDFRIGLAAHDLAGALGAPEVVLSRAARDADGPTIPSRFLLRVEALMGDALFAKRREVTAIRLAQSIDDTDERVPKYAQPKPRPSKQQRDVPIAVTALDRLRGDPYQFYAASILRLRRLDALDAEATPAWQGELAHHILERWLEERSRGAAPDIEALADNVLEQMHAHQLARALWRPRLLKGLHWTVTKIEELSERQPVAWEIKGAMEFDGVRLHGQADRIDQLDDGSLAIVDYKTGQPPRPAQIEAGYALQLGLLGLIAQRGGFQGIAGNPSVFEYWSLAKTGGSFGSVKSPIKESAGSKGFEADRFLPATEHFLSEAINGWIKGDRPFTARMNPDYEGYNDYDQLMRLDEWYGRDVDRNAALVEPNE